jgi:hypothetical protein
LGFAGGVVSGGVCIPAPLRSTSIKHLARIVLKQQMELFDFVTARSLISNIDDSVIDQTLSEWEASFEKNHGSSPVDQIIWQKFENRDLKRIRFVMAPALRFTQLVFPYIDSRVMETYFSLPADHLHLQRAHCYAGFYRYPAFGKFRACSYPISLRTEARFPQLLNSLRALRRLTPHRPPRISVWSEFYERKAQQVRKSPMWSEEVKRLLKARNGLRPKGLNKLRTLSQFHEVMLENSEVV